MAKKTTTTKKVAKKATTTKKVAKKATTTKKVAKKAATTKKVAKKVTKKVAKKVTKKVATAKAAKPAVKKVKRKPNAAFMKELTPSVDLAAVVGEKPLPRTQVVKKIWDYIKKNNLQNPKNRRNILADEKLKKIFGKKEITMFELAKIVGLHLK